MTTNASTAATPAPETTQPAPAPKPNLTAPIAERMAAKANAIRAKGNNKPTIEAPDAGSGGAPEPANDNAGKAGAAPLAQSKAESATDAPNLSRGSVTTDPEAAGKGAEGTAESKADQAPANDNGAAQAKAERKEAIALAIQRKNIAKRERRIEAREKAFGETTARDAAERERLEQLKKTDVLAYVRETTGKPLRELLEQDLKSEKAEPKVKLEDLPPELRARLEQIDEFEKRDKERQEREAAAQDEARRAKATHGGQAMIRSAFESESADYPHLAKFYDADTVVATAWEIAVGHFEETGEEVDLRKIFAYMEGNAEKEKARWADPIPAPTVKGGSPNGQTAPSKSASPEPVTMTQSDAASGAPQVRSETMEAKRDRIRRRASSR
jgi:hypothetical protein